MLERGGRGRNRGAPAEDSVRGVWVDGKFYLCVVDAGVVEEVDKVPASWHSPAYVDDDTAPGRAGFCGHK